MKKVMSFIGHLPQKAFLLLMSVSASGYVVVIYLIKEGMTLRFLPEGVRGLSYIAYLAVPTILSWICLRLSGHLPKCGMECEIAEVELASHSFLPSYLGYFFVALSIPNIRALAYVYAVILLFTYLSQALSFNPMYLLFRYSFYFVTGEDGTKIFLITRQKMKPRQDVVLDDLRRINDFTFIDMR